MHLAFPLCKWFYLRRWFSCCLVFWFVFVFYVYWCIIHSHSHKLCEDNKNFVIRISWNHHRCRHLTEWRSIHWEFTNPSHSGAQLLIIWSPAAWNISALYHEVTSKTETHILGVTHSFQLEGQRSEISHLLLIGLVWSRPRPWWN